MTIRGLIDELLRNDYTIEINKGGVANTKYRVSIRPSWAEKSSTDLEFSGNELASLLDLAEDEAARHQWRKKGVTNGT